VVSQVLHEHAATLSAAGPTIRSRRLIKCAKDSGQDLQGWETWFAGINGAAGGRLMPVLGGVEIRDRSGAVIGAMGIAGAAGTEDEEIAVVAIGKAGLRPEIGGEKPPAKTTKRK